jgi:hypothetical protein
MAGRQQLSQLLVVALGLLLAACSSTGTVAPARATPSATTSTTPGAIVSATPGATGGGCPSAPTSAGQMVQIGTAKAASCFGQTALTVDGYTVGCGGCGGVELYDRTPNWLAMMIPLYFMGPTAGESGIGPTLGFPVFIDPALGLVFPPLDTPVRVTGHFNDAIARTCRVVPMAGLSAPPLNPNAVIARCQQSFVVSAVTVITQ